MHHAVDKGNLELVRSLLVYKPDLDIVSKVCPESYSYLITS